MGVGRIAGSQGLMETIPAPDRTSSKRELWVPTWGTLTDSLLLSLPEG